MAKVIISANYVDRSNRKHRWLTRNSDDLVVDAVSRRAIFARNVSFRDSWGLEKNFGCELVAVTEEALDFDFDESTIDLSAAQKLEFETSSFVDAATGNTISSVDKLFLSSDGSVYALREAPAIKDDVEHTHEIRHGSTVITKVSLPTMYDEHDFVVVPIEEPTPIFSFGDRVTFKQRSAPSDLKTNRVAYGIVVSFDLNSDGDYCVAYDDGLPGGDIAFCVPRDLMLFE